MSKPDSAVVDDVEHGRFVYREGDAEGELTYRARANRLILVHTGVDDALRGRGIAGRLVRAAVERAAASGETVVPWCPYVRTWLRDHPDDAARIEVDWSDPPDAAPPGG